MEREVSLTKMVIRFILVVLESVLLWSFLRALPYGGAGCAAGIAGSGVLIAITIFFSQFKRLLGAMWGTAAGKAVLIVISVLLIAGIAYCITLSVLMARAINEGEDKKPGAVIVLGCQIRDDAPSRMLRHRLDTAYDILKENDDCICIVSGGKGSDEKYTEASVMKSYLVDKGIDPARITEEGGSTSTRENMRYSKQILDDMGFSGEVCFVSDGYHLYRSELIAENEGLDAYGAAAPTEMRFITSYWVREWLSLTYYFLTK